MAEEQGLCNEENLQLYKRGLLAPNSGNYLDNVSPVNGQVYSYVPDSDAQDVEVAIQAAKELSLLGAV